MPVDSFDEGRFHINILYLDNHLLAVEKPPGMPVQRDRSGDMDLLTCLKGYVGRVFDKPGAVYLGLVHRLDRPVGGAMVFARTSKAAARLSKAFAAHEAQKQYLCVARGSLSAPREMSDYLVKDERTGMVRVAQPGAPGAKLARLTSCPIAARDGLTLLRVTLKTGRAHQIRVQHAARGLPLWGDARYGNGRPGENIALWAWRLTVEHPTRKIPCVFEALPDGAAPWPLFAREIKELKNEG